MRSHFEGTALDMTGASFPDVGASNSQNPFRTHPLTWSSKGRDYLHERPIATEQTGWNFVGQSRSYMPRELSGVLWFGVDDSSTTVHFPIYGSATEVPEGFAGKGAQDGVVPPLMTFDMNSAFYAFNLVANWAYSRWDIIYPDVLAAILAREHMYFCSLADIDVRALTAYSEVNPAAAVALVTEFSTEIGNQLVKDWGAFFGELFVKYRDGYKIVANPESKSCGCSVKSAGYPQEWLDRIVLDTNDHYLYDPKKTTAEKKKFQPQSKLDLLANL